MLRNSRYGIIATFALAVTLMISINAQADGINFHDTGIGQNKPFYRIFNDIFQTNYTNSNTLFSALNGSYGDTWDASGAVEIWALSQNQTGFTDNLYIVDSNTGFRQLAISSSAYTTNGPTDQLLSMPPVVINPRITDFYFELEVSHVGSPWTGMYSLDSFDTGLDSTTGRSNNYLASMDVTNIIRNNSTLWTSFRYEADANYILFTFEDYKVGHQMNQWTPSVGSDWDYGDLTFIIKNITTATYGGDPVPEPGTLVLFGTGLLGAALATRRKMKK